MAELLLDGAMDFLGGQDASRIPDRVPENAYYSGINTSVRRGALQPRWGFEGLDLQYPDGYIFDPYRRIRRYKELYESGKWQMAAPYFVGTRQYIVVVVGGVIFLFNPETYELGILPIEDGSHLNARARRLNWEAAGRYLVIHDFPAFPVIIDGLEARRADPAKYEVPVSTIGAFNQNRLFVANNGNEFTGGDPVGSAATPDAPITFEEVLLPAAPYYGQIFQLPTSDHNDPISYMGFLQSTDISTGIGPLVVGTERAVYAYNTQNPRAAWEQGNFGSLVVYNAGVAGPRAWANVNSDAFFMSNDGYVRSLSMSRNSQNQWARVPISREVENWFKYWDRSLISLGFVSYFGNKIFFSVNPYRVEATDFATAGPISDYAHGGLVVMELDSLSSFGETSKPIWTGLWTGVRPMDMVTIGDRAFIFAKDGRVNKIYEVNPEITYDTANGKIRPVRSRIYTREMDFKDPFANKEIHSLDLNLDNLQGDFEIDVKYKPSHGAAFLPWRTFKHKAPWRTCGIPEGCFFNGFAPHQIRDLTLGAPEAEACSPITRDYYRVFKKIQLQLTLQGKYWEVHEFRVKATPKPQTPIQTICSEFSPVSICDECNDDWDILEFESCQIALTT